MYRRQESRPSQEKEMQKMKTKMIVSGALTSKKRRESKGTGKRRIYPLECRVPKNSKER